MAQENPYKLNRSLTVRPNYWQYAQSRNLNYLYQRIGALIKEYYPAPVFTYIDLDVAINYALTIIGQRFNMGRASGTHVLDGSHYDDPMILYDQAVYDGEIRALGEIDYIQRSRLTIRILANYGAFRYSVYDYCRIFKKVLPQVQLHIRNDHALKTISLEIVDSDLYTIEELIYIFDGFLTPMGVGMLIIY